MKFGKFQADNARMAELRTSRMVGDVMTSVAADMASEARSIGTSEYSSRGRIVQGGKRASDRAGAEVVDVLSQAGTASADGWPSRVLVNLSRRYQMRGGG